MEPILLRSTLRITEGHLAEFERAVADAVAFDEERGPQLMVQVFVDEPRLEACSFQLYRDSASILTHWRMADPYIRRVLRHCTPRRLDIYGRPDAAVMDGLREAGDRGVPLTVTPRLAGFVRFPISPAAA
jgi:hypothetical protein